LKINIFWFRRDLRLDDNTALDNALFSGLPVLPLFIFDTNITNELPPDDPRISFIYDTLSSINKDLQKSLSSVQILKGDPETIWKKLIETLDLNVVFINRDYEPYGIKRDNAIEHLLGKNHIPLKSFKDHVIFEGKEIIKSDNNPYTIFTPYKNRWLQKLEVDSQLKTKSVTKENLNYYKCSYIFPTLKELGFRKSSVRVIPYDLSVISDYDIYHNIPSEDKTSYLGPHLRFGTVSIRKIAGIALEKNAVFLSELIWRDFFMQILFNFPDVVTGNFKTRYDNIEWRNNDLEFERWCRGETGYNIVDAGMRQLNKTGYMHNRVRMITAGFLCKHLLIDWRWGEAYFAQKLLDYDLSSNNGNWQWAAGTGCDAVPYFRIFNPETQQKNFDHDNLYIKNWVENLKNSDYPGPIVDHDFARIRAIEVYKAGIRKRV
jgi:deoxyribodipyrimidine photo-lyase